MYEETIDPTGSRIHRRLCHSVHGHDGVETGMTNRVIKGKRYWLVPSIKSGSCNYCLFYNPDNGNCALVDSSPPEDKRYGSSHNIGCNPMDEDADYIFVKRTKKAFAAYIAHRLDGVHEVD